MARNRCHEGVNPFIKPEDLHLWLISLSLLMILTSSLSFASQQFRLGNDPPWVDFAILVNWGIVFGACVIMWSLARTMDNEKAEWKLLYLSMASVLVPRSCFPLRFGECVMHDMCFAGFNFFIDNPSWKTHVCCGFAVVVVTISDFAWGTLPPLFVVVKAVSAVVTVGIGYMGYQIVQVFHRNLREAKRPTLPMSCSFTTAAECKEKGRSNGLSIHPKRETSFSLPHRDCRRRIRIFNRARASAIRSKHVLLTKCSGIAVRSGRQRPHLCAVSSNRVDVRRYWTTLDNYASLFFQAVQRRLILCKDDMLRYVTEIEDSGVWSKDKEPQLFVVPSCHYGYVDSKWYLDMSLPRPFRGYFCHSFRAGTKSMHFMPAARASPEQAVPDAAIAWTTSATPTYTACMGFDSVEAMRRYRSLFRSSVSAEHSHNDQCNSCENGTLASAHPCRKDRHQTCRQQGCPQPGERNSGAAESAVIKLQQNHDSVLHKEDQSKAGRVTDFVGHDDSSGRCNDRIHCTQRTCGDCDSRCFLRSRRLAWKLNASEPTKCAMTLNRPCLHAESQWCGCLKHPSAQESNRNPECREPYGGLGIREETVMPRMTLGKFEDSAIERWYLLWRAECVPGFYKEISNINLLICGLQCIFEVLKGFAVECFGLAVDKNHATTDQLEFLGLVIQKPSWGLILSALCKPLLEFGILSALIIPMKFMESRGARDAWKFQLLGLGQAVTYMIFTFCDLSRRSFTISKGMHVTEATKIPKGMDANFVVGGHLILPMFIVALTVHLRRIPEATILFTSATSAVVTVVILSIVGWEFKVVAFLMLSRIQYSLFAIMVARAFENVRRKLFSTQVLPFLMYLSTLANSQRVKSICALRTERRRCGCQHIGRH
ncbi:hypothetical protein, conserved [Eimeria tenella]|uniref:Uncharacterized protein n=1 Tax=Eimeria tenella TaxID=5802 RepID=U6KNH6_EIMTE|nr:hypothetical protein, conserved [Eimeria tenella]CDJ37003.1 hypothetical protein, conserved [Eimeria tenella]|eukprot:XP_013227841.1 hypothetical protein, conserved [Eimeria tenella]